MPTIKGKSDYGFEIISKNGMNLNESQKFVDDMMDRADPEWVASKKEVYLLNENTVVFRDHGSDEMHTLNEDDMTMLNEDAPPSPMGMAIGAGVTLAVCVAIVVREYKKLKAKEIAAGRVPNRKRLILEALSATANEIQRAKA